LRLFSGGYRLALAALAFVVFGAYDSYPNILPEMITNAKKVFLDFVTIQFFSHSKDFFFLAQ